MRKEFNNALSLWLQRNWLNENSDTTRILTVRPRRQPSCQVDSISLLSKLTFNSLCILCSFTHDDTFARVLPKNVGLFLFSPFNTFSCRNTNFFFIWHNTFILDTRLLYSTYSALYVVYQCCYHHTFYASIRRPHNIVSNRTITAVSIDK